MLLLFFERKHWLNLKGIVLQNHSLVLLKCLARRSGFQLPQLFVLMLLLFVNGIANTDPNRDSNGTVFGYNPLIKSHRAGEFGHNDYYPVAVAAA